ncbi:MAG: phosphopyruvate hydratase [Ruminococcaceae bacterium]|nr:phosphopyruvate hydratase [Oscillospiraceae bacterium]
MLKTQIISLSAREILDSRGNPTLEACAVVRRGAEEYAACASVPSGASTGEHEAHELRDGGERYGGKGVLRAVESVNGEISAALTGLDPTDQSRIDTVLRCLDGTANLSRLGANAVLGASLACARAAAMAHGLPLYRFLGGAAANRLPLPMMNILNGGVHAANLLDIQEFMIIPDGSGSFQDALRMGTEVYHALKRVLSARSLSTSVGDEGGFAPMVRTANEACALIVEAIGLAGYNAAPGSVTLALDAAASEWVSPEGGYVMPKSGKSMTARQLITYWKGLVSRFPIVSIEDGVGENDWESWTQLTASLGKQIMLVGDDLFVTDPARVMRGIELGAANAVLIKPNQIGTLSDVFEAVRAARRGGYRVIMSHRSGETEDNILADLAVAAGADFIKSGAPARAERTAKYNRLLAIENELQ